MLANCGAVPVNLKFLTDQPKHRGCTMENVSSGQTFLFKVVLPVAWIAIGGTVVASLAFGLIHAKQGTPIAPELKWMSLALWAAGTLLILGMCSMVKRVRMDESHLYISNFRREIAVPYSNVARVRENPSDTIYPVFIYFRTPTEFGRKVMFLTRFKLSTWGSHSVAEEIKKRAGIAD